MNNISTTLFRINNIQLICGDCIDALKQIPSESIDLLITDPPYKTTSRGNAGNSGGMLQKDINKKGKYLHITILIAANMLLNFIEF